MRVENLPPLMARNLMAALPKVLDGFQKFQAAADAVAPHTAQQQAAQAASQSAPATSVQMLVTLAAADPVIEQRRRAVKNAERGLDALETLHTELLTGTVNVERLREIADWTATIDMPEDPQLAGLLNEIDVRVRVELAKIDLRA